VRETELSRFLILGGGSDTYRASLPHVTTGNTCTCTYSNYADVICKANTLIEPLSLLVLGQDGPDSLSIWFAIWGSSFA
jgi:hypothetical protein